MKLLIIGQEFKKSYTGLADSYYRAFTEIQTIETQIFDLSFNFNNYLISRFSNRIDFINKYFIDKVNEELLNKIRLFEPNIVLVIKGANLLPTSIEQIKNILKSSIIACYNPDNPMNLESKGSTNKNIIESIPLYDVYFTFSNIILKNINKLNKNVFYIPFAADTKIIYPVYNDCDSKYHCEVSFIGDIDEERRNIIKHVFTLNNRFKIRVYGFNLKLTQGIEKFNFVDGKDFLCALSFSKINLNILRLQNKHSHNMRTFEIPAAKGFMLHERSEEAMEFFIEGKEAEFFSTPEELNDKTKYFLKHKDIRERIALAGYNKIFTANYTYDNQAHNILNKINEYI